MIPVRWDRITPEDFAVCSAPAAASKGYRIFAVLLPEEAESAPARAPGSWTSVGGGEKAEVWELAPDR